MFEINAVHRWTSRLELVVVRGKKKQSKPYRGVPDYVNAMGYPKSNVKFCLRESKSLKD